jgi:hypothetical protein
MEEVGYSDQAAEFIAEAERIAALGLPQLPDDPAAAAAMRERGYEVLAEAGLVSEGTAFVTVAGEDGTDFPVAAADLCAALGVSRDQLEGTGFVATARETAAEGYVLSAFRPLP